MSLDWCCPSVVSVSPHGDCVVELPWRDPADVFPVLCQLPHCVFLDSAAVHPLLGRYSYLAAAPWRWIESPAAGSDCLGELTRMLGEIHSPTLPGLPPFQGGAAGLFSFELRHAFERLPEARYNEQAMPAVAMGIYDVVFAFDHFQRLAWGVSRGWPAETPLQRRTVARERWEFFRRFLAAGQPERPSTPNLSDASSPTRADFHGRHALTAPRYSCGSLAGVRSTFSRDGYLATIQRAIDYIRAGDVFQVNLAQELIVPSRCRTDELYLSLRARDAAPFGGYFDLGRYQIVSASPELFLKLDDGIVHTRPIKGTRRRLGDAVVDAEAARSLLASEKDRAENIMIVDLLRNDLSRVCRPESIAIRQLCEIEEYRHVIHLVSAIEGRLSPAVDIGKLIAAVFPGGSVTGAPKIRATEIISELEPTSRGAYCGSLGFVGADGRAELNLLIRTITAGGGWWRFSVGGGIVAQSEPEQEWQETMDKAAGLLAAIEAIPR